MITNKHYTANDGTEIYSVNLDNMSDLLDIKNSSSDLIIAPNKKVYSHHTNRYRGGAEWFGRNNKGKSTEVIRHAVVGDESLLSIVEDMGRKLDNFPRGNYEEIITKRKRKRIKGPQGDELDIHKVYSGQLDTAWSKMVRTEQDQIHHLVTLMIDVGANANIDAEDSLWNAAVAVRVADSLIKAGKSVRIMVGSTCYGLFVRGGGLATTSVTVKQYNEPLSMARLAAMSHAGFHRAFNFPVRSLMNRAVDIGMGMSVEKYNMYAPAHLKEEVDKGHTRYIYLGRSYSEIDARRNIRRASDQLLKEVHHEAA